MTNTLLDLSRTTELRWLSRLIAPMAKAAGGLSFFIAGATARDLILQHGYGINTGRKTRDVDIAVMLKDWAAFEALRTGLIETG